MSFYEDVVQENTSENYLKIFWLDTSVLAKIFLNEKGSKEIRTAFSGNPGYLFYTSGVGRVPSAARNPTESNRAKR
jgi:hypothetical protein